jgi:hypothetical protein
MKVAVVYESVVEAGASERARLWGVKLALVLPGTVEGSARGCERCCFVTDRRRPWQK